MIGEWDHIQNGSVDSHICVHIGNDSVSLKKLGKDDMMNEENGIHLKSHERDEHCTFVTIRTSLSTNSVAKKRFSTYWISVGSL